MSYDFAKMFFYEGKIIYNISLVYIWKFYILDILPSDPQFLEQPVFYAS